MLLFTGEGNESIPVKKASAYSEKQEIFGARVAFVTVFTQND